jgi:hypothetical protein
MNAIEANAVNGGFEVRNRDLLFKVQAKSFAVWRGERCCFELEVGCAVKSADGENDRDQNGYRLEQREISDGTAKFAWIGRSNLWDKKEYLLKIFESGFLFSVRVSGRGTLGEIEYFPGSWYEFSRYFIPNPTGGALSLPQYHSPEQSGAIAMHYHTPPLLAFPFQFEPDGWLALGLAPRPGDYNIERFDYKPGKDGFSLSTDYLGYTRVDGSHEVAGIAGAFGTDEYGALAGYAEVLYTNCGCIRKSWSDSPRWWHGPLFCGWGEQAALNPADQFAAANQKDYTWMSKRLDELELKPTAMIVDDKWMARYGEALPDPAKWPDMRTFTDTEHRKGRKVVLWFKSWNTEGLDADECVHLYSLPQGADPTSPKYRKRLQETFHRLLSPAPGCYDCDGFKVDFANVMPRGRELRSHGGVYGLELLKSFMKLVYDTAKSVKPECLINNSCAHPYFAEVTDQCRLHDYSGKQRSAWRVMSYRQKLYRAAMPDVPIDTDTVRSTYRETLEYIERCHELGAPDLYFLSGTERVPFDARMHDAIRRSWREYDRRF